MLQSFKKQERLCSRKIIKELFEKGHTISSYPLKMIWMEIEHSSKFPVQIVISVPKRNIKKAVTRNKIKRQIREAYRKNKINWYKYLENKNKQCAGMFIYTAKNAVLYKEIELIIIGMFDRLVKEHEATYK